MTPRTSIFEILEIYAGWILQSVRRHLFWNPSNRRRSAVLTHALARPYNSLLTITAWKTSSFRSRVSEVQKSGLAAPNRLDNSLLIRRSTDKFGPK